MNSGESIGIFDSGIGGVTVLSEIIKLLSEGVIRNTKRGYVDHRGEQVGYYRTKGVARKRYIEDKYVK